MTYNVFGGTLSLTQLNSVGFFLTICQSLSVIIGIFDPKQTLYAQPSVLPCPGTLEALQVV